MMISTRGRYALRVMVELAAQDPHVFTPLKAVAARQGLSHKYLEGIMTRLAKAGLVEVAQGKHGGFRLGRAADTLRVGDILRETETSLVPVACLEATAPACPRAQACRTQKMWRGLAELIENYLDGVTIADLAAEHCDGDPDV